MYKVINECVGCPEGMGCLGSSCPYRNVPVITCDECGGEISDDEYVYEVEDGEMLCEDCMRERYGRKCENIIADHADDGREDNE